MFHNQLTLVVTLKDRFDFTKRLCEYLSSISYPFEVLFADGSIGDEHEAYFQNQNAFKFSYEYVRYPKDESLKHFYSKCADILQKVKTPYTMLADNDDFPIIDGQLRAITFLDAHRNYVGVNGGVAGISLSSPGEPYARWGYFSQYYCSVMDRPVSLDFSTAQARIRSYLKNFNSIYYAIYRTYSLKKTLIDIECFSPTDLGIYELYFSYHQLVQGKIHQLDRTTYIRQKGSSQSAASQKGWMDRLFYTNWLVDLQTAIQLIAQRISEHEGGQQNEFYDMLYYDFVERQKHRFISNNFYVKHNFGLLINLNFFCEFFLRKLFRLFPLLALRFSQFLLSKKCLIEDLQAIQLSIKFNDKGEHAT